MGIVILRFQRLMMMMMMRNRAMERSEDGRVTYPKRNAWSVMPNSTFESMATWKTSTICFGRSSGLITFHPRHLSTLPPQVKVLTSTLLDCPRPHGEQPIQRPPTSQECTDHLAPPRS